ncbi:hypothetical protein EAS64_24285 [Trebonia kvetii]|uniref:SCP2 domain-containing protein n=2 Tax=Trebonia kvetii TaxID=2480626 RepID=A0A6P2BZ69_9ACTN|nr:hypothetical protein EAS64_24285 [Trebonia kvetii]
MGRLTSSSSPIVASRSMAASTRGSPVGARAGGNRSGSIVSSPRWRPVSRLVLRVRYPPLEPYRPPRSDVPMASAEECRTALQKLAGRLSELSPADREQYFGNRRISVTIPDLDVTYVTVLGTGDDPVRELAPGEPPADIRMTAKSDEVVSLAEQPMNIARAWMSGRVKIEASVKDLFRLRRLL